MSRLSKQLDEAKANLKRELEGRQSAVRSEEEFSRLLSEVGQLNLVRESNAHLRADNEELYKKLQVLKKFQKEKKIFKEIGFSKIIN